MKSNASFHVLFSAEEVADLLNVPLERVQSLIGRRLHPDWIWTSTMSRPRWAAASIPAWLRILDGVDLDGDGMPGAPNPTELFRESRSVPTTTAA